MTTRDLFLSAAGNLWRMKLRASLTIAGVVIAIAAFVAMLSFGAGMQESITDQFNDLGLFSTMLVYPLSADELARRNAKKSDEKIEERQTNSEESFDTTFQQSADTYSDTSDTNGELDTIPAKLDSAAIALFSDLPGVNLVYPHEDFTITVKFADSSITTKARTLPVAALGSKLYSNFKAGYAYDSDTGHFAIVTKRLLDELGIDSAEHIVGETIIVSVSTLSLDSALTNILFDGDMDIVRAKISEVAFDSLGFATYREELFSRELSDAIGRFVDGYLNSNAEIADTLVVTGALEGRGSRRTSRPVMFSVATGERLSSGGFSGDKMQLMSVLASGQLFNSNSEVFGGEYKRVTLDLDPNYAYTAFKDTIEALGYRTFSYAEEFAEIQQIFLYLNMALGLIGMIALVTASLGIVNTMVMSILERRREIGVLKSLGADDSDIRALFLFESGMIGSVGALGGIALGWVISRVASFISQEVMIDKGVDPIDLFNLPLWLVAMAFLIGLVVSVVAGYYPAARAAKVDPVQALRAE
ncbi:ABC transporter permease [Gemmatimonas aurantiaca]|nr:ABC transporter permease [Gemmatimonas aurantiaca]